MIDFLPYFWLAVIIFMSVCEFATAQLVSVWFVFGAIAAMITSLVTDNWIIQVVVFIVVTAITLIATRPLVRKIKSFKKTETNSDRCVGKLANVNIEINNSLGQGQVNVEGSIWSARSTDGCVIPAGTCVKIDRIEGVKLMVTPQYEVNH